ncbi:hypothetical protein BdWA1_001822 [Babesia duncani]|uniref:RNA-editing substrate-binding complex 6 protein domain-containing protein n=1 Tax=Babesia duncani TaxID=323732 RepID=A0AAD9PKX3_9APIC|nr:hypothetical protein BdWA1_001822 [Babesia duncani]
MHISRITSYAKLNTKLVYDAGTKASIKVYHLQELAKARKECIDSKVSTTEYANYSRKNDYLTNKIIRKYIDDYIPIVKEVDLLVSQLSPTQLLATAIAYSLLPNVGKPEWNRLCGAVNKHAYSQHANVTGISSSEVAMVLYCFAKVFKNQTHSSFSLLRWVTRDIGNLNERDVGMILFYMRRTKCVPYDMTNRDHVTFAKILRSITMGLSTQGGNKLVKYTPSGVVSVVYNFAAIGMVPWFLIYKACNLVYQYSHRLKHKEIALHSRSLAMLKFRDTRTLKNFANLINDADFLNTTTITCLLYSYAKLKYRPKCGFKSLLSQIQRGIFQFKDEEVAQIAYALGQLGIKCDDVFNSISLFVQNRIEFQCCQHFAMLIQAYSRVGIYDPNLMDAIVKKSLQVLSGFTLSQVVCILDGCVVLGHFDKVAFNGYLKAITNFSEDNPPDHLLNQLNRIMYCIRLEHPRFLEDISTSNMSLINQYQGPFLITSHKKCESLLFECLNEMQVEFERHGKIDFNTSMDVLTEASFCPISGSILGAPKMKKRHIEKLGYRHYQIRKKDWFVNLYIFTCMNTGYQRVWKPEWL